MGTTEEQKGIRILGEQGWDSGEKTEAQLQLVRPKWVPPVPRLVPGI